MFAQPGADVVPPRQPSPTLGCARAGGTPIALGVPPRPPRHWGEARMPAGGGRGRRRAHHCCYGDALKTLGGESPAGAGMGAPGHVAAGAWPDRVPLRLRRLPARGGQGAAPAPASARGWRNGCARATWLPALGVIACGCGSGECPRVAEWVRPSHVAAGAWRDRVPLLPAIACGGRAGCRFVRAIACGRRTECRCVPGSARGWRTGCLPRRAFGRSWRDRAPTRSFGSAGAGGRGPPRRAA